jgi:hypothetical protein
MESDYSFRVHVRSAVEIEHGFAAHVRSAEEIEHGFVIIGLSVKP